LGHIALTQGSADEAEAKYGAALALYQRIPDPYSVGVTYRDLARAASEESRVLHVAAAREAWRKIKRDDLVAQLDTEFGPPAPEGAG
jgi:hypothetical protein